MSEAVTVPGLMMMTLTVSEASLVRDRQTDRHIGRQTVQRLRVVYFKLFQSKTFENKNQKKTTNPHAFIPLQQTSYLQGEMTRNLFNEVGGKYTTWMLLPFHLVKHPRKNCTCPRYMNITVLCKTSQQPWLKTEILWLWSWLSKSKTEKYRIKYKHM